MIDQSEIAQTILCSLYLDYFDFGGTSNLPLLAGQGHWDERTASRIIEDLEERGLIRPFTAGGHYRITASGIIEAENNEIVPADVLTQNLAVRMSVLRQLAQLRQERGTMAGLHFAELAEHETVSRECLAWNTTFLQDVDLIEDFGVSSRITRDGLAFLQEHEQRAGIEAELARIKELPPHARGKALEQLVGRVAGAQGWSVVTNVKTNNEELD